MKCTIPGRGIKAFGKAIHCLAKIGDELYIEALKNGLALKTVNNARSAYACFLFWRSFFHSYSDGRVREGEGDSEDDTVKCKITIKSCVSVFKALSTLEKTVDHCRLHLDLEQCKLVFVFHCRHGIIKTHNLGFEECEALQAVFTKDLCPNHIAGHAKVLSEVVANFPHSLEEVTLIAEPARTRIKNYIEEESVDTRVPLTEISLLPAEFDEYQIGVDASITFCLKELRAILLFTDAINHSLSLRFETAGKPIVISIDDCQEYQADFVLATLLDSGAPTQPPASAATHSVPTQRKQKEAHNGYQNTSIPARSRTKMGMHSSMKEDSLRESSFMSGPDVHVPSAGARSQVVPDQSSHGTSLRMSQGRQPAATRVPTPPDSNLMETEFEPTSQHFNETNPSHRGPEIDYDPVDALFEVENQNDVAEGGNMFGFTHRTAGAETVPGRGLHSSRRINRDRSDAGPDKENVDSFRQDRATSLNLPDDDFFDDFPYKNSALDGEKPRSLDMFANRSHEQSGSDVPSSSSHLPGGCSQQGAREMEEDPDLTQAEDEPTQDSIINDSGFIPSTPPAKRFRSILFGVDMFSRRHNKSEVLAPDSEEEDD